MNSFELPDFAGDDDFGGNFFTDGVADGTFVSGSPMPWGAVPEADAVAAPPPLFLMPQPAPILLLSELDKFSQVKFIAHLRLKPANLDELLPEMLANSGKYRSITKGLGIKFWCDWCHYTSDDNKAARTALLNTGLPEELKAKPAFKVLSSGKKRTSGTRATTATRVKNTVDAPSAAVVAVAPPLQFSILNPLVAAAFQNTDFSLLDLDAIDIDDVSFDFNPDAFTEFDHIGWHVLDGISADDVSEVLALDGPREGSSVSQARRGSVKRSNTGPADSTYRKQRMLTADSAAENIPKEDIALFREHDVKAGIVHFLFRFKKKYESFKKLFQLNDMLTTPYEILQSSGFVVLQMINILHSSGGYKNLEALQALTVKAADQDQTPLQQLQAAGFEPTHIVRVLSNDGGYKNLEALQALTVKAADQDQTPLQQLQAAGFEPTHIVRVLSNDGGYKNLEALLNFIPHYVGLTAPEKTAFLSFVSKTGASTRVELAQRLIELHTDKIDKASLFDFLKSATNKSAVQFEALPLEQLVEQIKPKKAKRVPAGRPQTQTAVAAPIYHFVEGAFGGLAGVPGYNPDAIPKVPDGGQEVVAAQTAEV